MSTEVLAVLIEDGPRRRYSGVNGQWPDQTPHMTGPEALTATKLLWIHFLKKKCPYKLVVTSGRRNTWRAWYKPGGHFNVNPTQGWKEFIHDLSHWFHLKRYPNKQSHNPLHETLEREMGAYVISKGWLEGKLKSKAKPAEDPSLLRYKSVLVRMKAWESKKKRAETALRKLKESKAYYEKKLA